MSNHNLRMTSSVIGWGRSSTVYLGYLREPSSQGVGQAHERPVAVKNFNLLWCQENRERVIQEAAHHMSLSVFRHPFISPMVGVKLLPLGLALVMEYKRGVRTLDSFQESSGGRLPQSVARQLFAQLMIALDFCHRVGLSNRDCKINDLLIHVDQGSGDVKLQLTDFSFAKDNEHDWDGNPAAQNGSALFAAPEVIKGSPDGRYPGYKADVWSAGVLLCMLMFDCHPHLAPDRLQASPTDQIANVVSNARRGAIQVPAVEAATQQDVFQLMADMLAVDPAARPNASEVLSHPWVRAVLSSTPGLAELNDWLLSDIRLRAESIVARQEARTHIARLLGQMLGDGAGVGFGSPASSYHSGHGSVGGARGSGGGSVNGDHVPRGSMYG